MLKAGKGGEFEKEGYGARPYDNWETVMFDARDQVCPWPQSVHESSLED